MMKCLIDSSMTMCKGLICKLDLILSDSNGNKNEENKNKPEDIESVVE